MSFTVIKLVCWLTKPHKTWWQRWRRLNVITEHYVTILILYSTWYWKHMAAQQPPAPVSGIRPPPPVCLGINCAENWRYFTQKWLNYAVITNLANQRRQYQVALLLHVLGEQALKIYNGFHFASTENNWTVAEILEKFDQFAIGEINEIYERYVFNNCNQHESETYESYLAMLILW